MELIKINHNYTGASLLDLLEMYGKGNGGFYSDWWVKEKFAQDHLQAGKYELIFDPKLVNLTFSEQEKKIGNNFEVAHPAVILEAILFHYKEKKEYLLEDWYVRTSVLDSLGRRVFVGRCDAGGVSLSYHWDGSPYGSVGVGASRKFTKTIEPQNLDSLESFENRLSKIENWAKTINYKE